MRPPTGLSAFGLRVWSGSVTTPFPPHRHNEIELNAVEEGYFTYLLAGREVTVSASQVALFWGAIPHQVIRSAPATHLYWATIPLDYALHWDLPHPFVQELLIGRWFLDQRPLFTLSFFQQWESDLIAGHQASVLMEVKALFFRFAQTRQPDPVPPEISAGHANQMALFMSRHFHEPITAADIARQVSLHPNYAMTVFRETFGLSLIDYLTQQRIAHAQQLLIVGDAPIADVALESGFSTLSRFYTAFRRLCGTSPGHYRTSLRA